MLYQQYNLSENLPKNINFQLNELYPVANSELSFFMKHTKYCHKLFHWSHRRIKDQDIEIFYLNCQEYEMIQAAIKKKKNISKLSCSIKTPFGTFSHICKDPYILQKHYKKTYIKSLKVYLIKKE